MILAQLSDARAYEGLHSLFPALFRFLRTHDLAALPAGRVEIDGDNLFVNVVETVMIPPHEQKLEVHRAYIDIHVPLTAVERVGLTPLSELSTPSLAPFDTKADFALYDEPAAAYADVRPGQFLVCMPEDAHAPLIGSGPLRKLIAKVRID